MLKSLAMDVGRCFQARLAHLLLRLGGNFLQWQAARDWSSLVLVLPPSPGKLVMPPLAVVFFPTQASPSTDVKAVVRRFVKQALLPSCRPECRLFFAFDLTKALGPHLATRTGTIPAIRPPARHRQASSSATEPLIQTKPDISRMTYTIDEAHATLDFVFKRRCFLHTLRTPTPF